MKRTAPALPNAAIAATALWLLSWAGCSGSEKTTASSGIATSSKAATSAQSSSPAAGATAGTTAGSGAPTTFGCNPLTGQGCDPDNICDTDFAHFAFVCYPGNGDTPHPGQNGLCARCGHAAGYCKSGSTCFKGKCAKYCCADADCASTGFCDKSALAKFGAGEVGLCMAIATGSGGAGGASASAGGAGGTSASAGGAGGTSALGGAGGMMFTAAGHDCSAPEASPSKGACVPGFGAGGAGATK